MAARNIVLDFARPADAETLAVMSRDLIEAGLGWVYRTERFSRLITNDDTVALVARANDRPVAFAVMEFGDERAHLVLLAVRPSHRRLGIGQRLLDWLLESARVAGMASIHLELRASNDAARRFYRAMGFYETVLVPGYYRSGEGKKEGALRMLRVLRNPGPVPYTWRPPKTEAPE